MAGKGLIKFFTVAFFLGCAYSLSFTGLVIYHENLAEEYGLKMSDDPIEAKYHEARYLDSIATEIVLDIKFKQFTYKEVKSNKLNLGLDLQGGMSLVLQVSLEEMIKKMSGDSKDEDFRAAIILAGEKQQNSQKDFVTLFGESFSEIAPEKRLSAIFAIQENKEIIKLKDSDEQILEAIQDEAKAAIGRTFRILSTRIDKFGVAQPNITLQELTGRITVELPGVGNPERVRKILQASAKLEFWETYENEEILNFIQEANDVLAGLLDAENKSREDAIEQSGDEEELRDVLETNEEDLLSTVETTLEISKLEEPLDEALSESEGSALEDLLTESDDASEVDSEADSIRDTVGLSIFDEAEEGVDTTAFGADFAKNNPLLALLKSSSYQNSKGQTKYQLAVNARDTSQFNKYMAMDKIKAVFPSQVRIYYSAQPLIAETNDYELIFIKMPSNENRAPLEGDAIVDASLQYDQISGLPEVRMTMNSEGANIWKRLTAANVGRRIAIVLDDAVYSAPVVIGEIPNGISSITGQADVDETTDLANILKAGKLPAPAKIVSEDIVGPSLGQESVNAGTLSLLVGLGLVLLFMMFYYQGGGIVANLALLTNLFFIIGALASLKATLTLPGMAGIVLTIGMAVDANVLIFERIREELRKGSGLKLAIMDGYKRSYSSIIDAQVTTFLVAVILLYFGLGPIKGFATVLSIGIISSMFTAILLSRIMIDWRTGKEKLMAFSNSITKDAFTNLNFDFIGKRKIAYVVSSIIILAGVASFLTKGFELGVDFEGGRSYVIRFDEEVKTHDVRAALTKAFETAPVVKTFGSGNQVKIVTNYLIHNSSTATDSIVEASLFSGLSSILGGTSEREFQEDYMMSSQKVGPTIADDIQKSAYWATIFSLIGIFLYILIRFRKWQYGVGAIIALFHNVLVLLTVYSILSGILPFSLEIDQAFIAALLTVIGYSINDTVVVFDRVREYLHLHHTKSMAESINLAINSTLSRTMITSFTTMLVVTILFIFGGEVIRGFSFAIMIGIVVGTYSSIFIATPIVADLSQKKGNA